MPKIRCKCPGCQAVLQFEARRTQALRMACPRCGRAFTLPAAQASSAAAMQTPAPADAQPANGLDELFAHLPPQSTSGHASGAGHASFGAVDSRYASAYAAPRAPKRMSAKAKKQLVTAVAVSVSAFVILATGLLVAIPLVRKAGVADLLKSQGGPSVGLLNFDSPQAVMSDLESECRRLEAIGRAIPEGEQSEAAAKTLLDGKPALVALLRRACRLPSVRVDLANQKPNALGQVVASPPAGVEQDPDQLFWRIQVRDTREEPVTEAINQLSSLRGSIYSLLTSGIVELPSPLEARTEQFDWTDEDRRILAAVHLVGDFRRDFTRALAGIESDAVNAETLKPLHKVIDQYSRSARELAETSRQMLEKAGLPSHRMFIEKPKRTPYHQQSYGIYAGLLSLQQNEFASWKDDPQFDFVMKESKQLAEDIEEIMFGANPNAIFASKQSSLERYQELADKRQADEGRRAELAAKQAREAQEKQRLAEERRLEEERKREQARAEQTAAANNQPVSPASTEDSDRSRPGGFAGPPSRRRPHGFPRQSLDMGGEVSDAPHARAVPARSPSQSHSRSVPANPQSTIVIKVRSESGFDGNSIVKKLAEKTGVKAYQSSQSNNQATMRFTSESDLKSFVDAIDFGTVESVDEPSRTISVTIP